MPMRTSCFLVLWFLSLQAPVHAQTASSSAIELVESIPVETVLDNPDIRNTQEVWLEMINAAKATLDIEQFYIANKPHEPLEDVIRAIEQAAQRGVRVRILGDARFYRTYPETFDRLSQSKNITTRIIDYTKLAGGVQHAKYFIVDGREVFLGSQNFDWRSLKHIHELGLRIRHREVVRFYLDIFDLDWQLAQTNDKALLPQYLSRKNSTFPVAVIQDSDTLLLIPTASPIGFIPDSSLWDEPHIIRLIDGAKREVSLQFLGYDTRARERSEYRVLDDALRRAAARGVRVRLLVSDWEKGTPAERALKDLSTVANIEVKFSVIPEWSGGYVSFARVEHCKFLVVDGQTFWLGTSNAEKSYFYTSRNVGVVVRNAALAGRVQRIFLKSWESSYAEPVDPNTTYQRRKHDGE
jgi:phosphatidylserine/phosphatidylglycerophosphate/cardiolipin synthase-like enzyme